MKIKYNIWETEGNLYTKEEIESMLKSTTDDPKQEYFKEYVVKRDSIFDPLDDKNLDDKLEEWR